MPRKKKDKEILLLIDSHALIHRAFHAFPDTLTTKDGEVVNAVYGFARLLLEVIAKFDPDYVVAAMDAPGPTVRHEQFTQYKANRSAPDELLIQQLPMIEELLTAFDIPMLKIEGYEADDIIGTLDARHSGKDKHTIIVTGDRDFFQLVDEDTSVYLAGTSFSKSQLFDAQGVKEKMGVPPENIIDIKALEGDSSDNIPGVAGIGKKGAVDLVSNFGSLDEIYSKIAELPNRYQNKLMESYEIAKLSRELATIIKDAPVAFNFKEAPFGTFEASELQEFFMDMEFRSLMKNLEGLFESYRPSVEQLRLLPDLDAEDDIPEWNGEQISGDFIIWHADYAMDGDPLHWELVKGYILHGEDTLLVSADNLANFLAKLSASWIVTTDAKAWLHCLINKGLTCETKVFDLGLSSYILAGGGIGQDTEAVLAHYHLGAAPNIEALLRKLGEAYQLQEAEASENPKQKKLLEIERRLISVVVAMERAGIILDKKMMSEFSQKLDKAIASLEKKIYEQAGGEFNISSPKQVGETLFDKMGLPSGKKTKTGNYATDERTLREIIGSDPIIQLILDYRELSKLQSTYVKPLPELVNSDTGRIHAVFNQLGAVTGRFSSQNPNMQNIPLGEVEGISIRDAFGAAKGKTLVTFDYSQQELRLLAELSGEENMQEAFRAHKDIHALTAAEIFEVALEDVDKVQRKVGKTINFGIIYGMSGFGFADRLKVDVKVANDFIGKYFEEYPRVKEYFDSLIKNAKEQGFVETILGRRRSATDLRASNWHVRSGAEREVMNFPLQGGAADITKLAMLEVAKLLPDYPAKLALQVHDELVFEYDISLAKCAADEKFREFVTKTRKAMLSVIALKVPLEVGIEIGERWGDMRPLLL